MQKIWLLAVCNLLLFATTLPVLGQSASEANNGYWWQSLDDSMKVGYVIGFVEGSETASSVWKMYNNITGKKMPSSATNPAGEQEDFSDIRFGQYEAGIDAFYKDFRNMSIHVADAMPYVRDQIKGEDRKSLDLELNLMRKLSVSPGYDN